MLIIVISFVCSTVQYRISTGLNSGDTGGGGGGGRNPGERGTSSPREAGKERAGDNIPKAVGIGRNKNKLHHIY